MRKWFLLVYNIKGKKSMNKIKYVLQVNALAAEKLYSLAGDWADLGPDTLLFDVCCGTGTIGLTLAHRVGMVIISYLVLAFSFICDLIIG